MAYEREANTLRFAMLKKGRTRWQVGRLMRTAHPGHDYRRCTIGQMRKAWLDWSEETRKTCERLAKA
jgi:hypothetical protein